MSGYQYGASKPASMIDHLRRQAQDLREQLAARHARVLELEAVNAKLRARVRYLEGPKPSETTNTVYAAELAKARRMFPESNDIKNARLALAAKEHGAFDARKAANPKVRRSALQNDASRARKAAA